MTDCAVMFCRVSKTQYAKLRKAFNLLVSIGITAETAASIIMDAYTLNLTRMEEERQTFERAKRFGS